MIKSVCPGFAIVVPVLRFKMANLSREASTPGTVSACQISVQVDGLLPVFRRQAHTHTGVSSTLYRIEHLIYFLDHT
jgi:hypothetical protein